MLENVGSSGSVRGASSNGRPSANLDPELPFLSRPAVWAKNDRERPLALRSGCANSGHTSKAS